MFKSLRWRLQAWHSLKNSQLVEKFDHARVVLHRRDKAASAAAASRMRFMTMVPSLSKATTRRKHGLARAR